MSEIKHPLSANSYTNKDFQTIYVELLEAAKTLAKNWDPTISNESDPGVVLLKLNAIIADKNNYNIDKNVLENYPETYTQDISARSQYKQLGYKMPWYKAATTDVTFRWVGTDEDALIDGDSVTIPKYTMVMDKEGQFVFTILQNATLGKIPNIAANTTSVPAIQGTINTLKLAGSTTITLANLDSKNRLYINDHFIAENGIFITSEADPNGVLWAQVDNVELQPFGTPCYEFDIDPKRNCPYVQFPEDIRSLIGSGLIVKYIVTSGYSGNISAKVLDTFYDQSQVDIIHNTGEKKSVQLSDSLIRITNSSETIDGQDPEGIESAYKSFRRKVCTFDTLVTLRDYINAIYDFGKKENALSNIIVTDRTNDIQSVYRIVDKDDGLMGYVDYIVGSDIDINHNAIVPLKDANHIKFYNRRFDEEGNEVFDETDCSIDDIYVEVSEDNPDLCAFDLKFYVLKSGGLLNNIESYNTSFDIDNTEETQTAILANIHEQKSIQHDLVDIKPHVPFMLQNIYPIKMKLVPTFKLNNVAQNELVANIKTALIKVLNSRECEFGKEPSYDLIYNEVINCDERIKVLIMDDFKYTTFAVYLGYSRDDIDGTPEFKYVPISDYSTCSRLIVRDAASCGCGSNCDCSTIISRSSTSEAIKEKLQRAADEILRKEKDTQTIAIPTKKQIEGYRFIDSTNGIMYKWADDAEDSTLKLYSSRLLDIRSEVIARNIMAGVTPLFETEDTKFKTALNMNQVQGMTAQVDHISTNLEIAPFGFDSTYSNGEQRSASYRLRANESLRFMAPSFITDRTYANYVKFELILKNPIRSNSEFTWADPNDEEALMQTYGNKNFYKQVSNNVYTPLYGSKYQPLTDTPRFKLLYHARVNRGNGPVAEVIKDSSTMYSGLKTIDSIFNKVEHYIPEFESNLYYFVNGNKFEVLEDYPEEIIPEGSETKSPFRYNLINGNYYRLKQYVNGLVPFSYDDNSEYVANKYFVYKYDVSEHINRLDSINQLQFDCLSTNGATYQLYYYDEESSEYLPIGYEEAIGRTCYLSITADSTKYQKEHFNNFISGTYAQITSDDLAEIVTCLEDLQIGGAQIYYYDNICDVVISNVGDNLNGSSTNNPRFEQVSKYSSNVYLKVIDDNGHLVGYKIVQSSNEEDFKDRSRFEQLLRAHYNSLLEDLGKESGNFDSYYSAGNIVVCKEPHNWTQVIRNNNPGYQEFFYVKYFSSSNPYLPNYTAPSAAPDYMIDSCLSKITNVDDTTGLTNVRYERITSRVNDWINNFGSYYKQENFDGLDVSSPEYTQWKNGSLSLYVQQQSYKLPANTEYQLRDGDCIVFFWRGTDEDDAPYTYRKYGHIYDADTGAKTIIKASFPINASAGISQIFNTDRLMSQFNKLNPSGEIPYDGAADSAFQKIFTKMYGEYDLSGSRQIEMRKMNSVKLDKDNNKYYYLITPDAETIELDGEKKSIFSMRFEFTKKWQTEKGDRTFARYQHILQPEEYFAYTNADQTLFEMLGEGTLIEYNKLLVDSEIEVDQSIIMQVDAINTNDILYDGIDAFKAFCKIVPSNDNFNLIEQQIYSFVKDDVIQISLNDNIDYGYIQSTKEKATYYRNYQFEIVEVNDEIVPKFVSGQYYQLSGVADINNLRYEDYLPVIEKPEGWDNILAWSTTGACFNKYFKKLFVEYLPTPLNELSPSEDDPNWLVRSDPEYPIFSTNNPTFIKDLTISYSAASQNNKEANDLDLTYTTLPSIDVEDDSYGWNVTAHLNIMSDVDKPQSIQVSSDNNQSRQSITINSMRFPEAFFSELDEDTRNQLNAEHQTQFASSQPFGIIDGKYVPLVRNEDELYVLSSVPLDKVGSEYIDVTYIDLLGERHDIELLSYQLNHSAMDSDAGWQIADEGITLKADKAISKDVPTVIERVIDNVILSTNYKYLLPIVVPNQDATVELWMNTGSGYQPVTCICCDTDKFTEGKHFITIPSNILFLKIIVTNRSTSEDVHILFETLFKYKYRQIFGGEEIDGVLEYPPKYNIDTSRIFNTIRSLDAPGKFKFTHIPNVDVRIDDPLDPIRIFDSNHVYNKFSIARAELDSGKPYDASFDIVNNR